MADGFVEAASGSPVLTNTDNTILGSGDLGAVDHSQSGWLLYLVNGSNGVIDASASTIPLTLDTGAAAVTNAGLIEATGVAGLTIENAVVDDSAGGAIFAGAGSIVTLQQADIIGGSLSTSGTGIISTSNLGLAQLDGTSFAVTNTGRVDIDDGQTLSLEGFIINSGKFVVYGANNPTQFRVLPKGVTLSGGGRIYLLSPSSELTGLSSLAVLTNVDNNISGAGDIGDGSLTLINDAKGVIVGSQSASLTIDTGSNTIVNAGIILARGAGGTDVESAVANSGILESAGGVLTVNGVVSGAGSAMVYSGTVDFTSSFSQNVVFQGTTGVLELAQSQGYNGTISRFSKTGGTSLDLRDIGFVSSTEATFSGTASGGVLTVTDGDHTVHITLCGDYLASTFIASSDGHGGTIVVDPWKAASMAASHRFVAALAGLGGSAGGAILAGESWSVREPVLVKPRTMLV